MINNIYTIGATALSNAQVSVNNASNNIANADTEGYQRTTVNYETSSSITISGLTVGTGATIESITANRDAYVEAQYLDAYAQYSKYSESLDYLDQLDSLFNQSDGGLSDYLSSFWLAWNDLSSDPDSTSAREALLGAAETLVYSLNSTSTTLENMEDAINSEIQDQVEEANSLILQIAAANASLVANPDDTQLISDRDQMIRDLNSIIGVDVIEQDDGSVTILTEEGHSLVDGTTTHELVYGAGRSTTSLMPESNYDGEISYSGSSSEEILIEFVSSGADGTAQFKVSLDNGATWLEDDDGSTLLYTAGDEDNSVEIEGVTIWFDGGTTDHAVGDRYTVTAKTGLYWERSEGSLVNITPLTDASGDDISGRTASGSLAGLFEVRDDEVLQALDSLDEMSEAIIWEVNSLHSTGAGLEHHTALTSSYSVEDSSALLSNSGLAYADNLESGSISLTTYDSDGSAHTEVFSVDLSTDTLDSLMGDVNAAFGSELSMSVDSDGVVTLSAGTNMSFEISGDTTGLLAALGLNTFFSGTDSSTISLDEAVTTDVDHINAGAVDSDGDVPSGSNSVANSLAALSETTVTINGKETTFTEYLAGLVSDVGASTSSTELKATYADSSATYYDDLQSSVSEVNVDEELVDLTKYQQAYQAAAEIISVAQTMMDTLLDLV